MTIRDERAIPDFLSIPDMQIEKVEPEDEEILEEWVRDIRSEVHGVDVCRMADPRWPWHIGVVVMEFVRDEPLVSELADALTAALSAVPGATGAYQEDRECWLVTGQCDGPTLVRAVCEVVDRFAPQTRAVIDRLNSGE